MQDVVEKTITKRVPKLRFAQFEKDWDETPLERVLDLKSGYIFKSSTYVEGGRYRVITIANVQDGSMSLERVCTVPELPENIRDFQVLQRGDILISLTGNVGRVCIVDVDDCLLNQRVGKLVPNGSVNKDFLYQVLRSEEFLTAMVEQAQGGAQDNLSSKDVVGYKSFIPTHPEQTKIAGFLSAVDGKIQQLTRKKALLEQYKKGVMQQLFSQEIRFKIPGKAGELVEPPEWEEKRLGEICTDISYGMNAAAVEYDGENKYLRITDIDENSHEFRQTGLTSPGNALEDKYVLREGDLLFARTGASVGKSYLYKKKDGKVYFAGFLIRFHVKEGVPEFIYAQTLTTEYGRWVTENSMRSGQPGLNAEEYKSFTIKFPCLEEQQRIAGFLSALDGRVATVSKQLEMVVQWKRGLLQQMFV